MGGQVVLGLLDLPKGGQILPLVLFLRRRLRISLHHCLEAGSLY
jgi:hypothetical protein